MSVLVSTCEEISKSSTNKSLSKQLYTFSRAPRFERTVSYTNNILFPDIKEPANKLKGAAIGFGKRSDYWLRNVKSKADKFYDYQSDFVKDKRVNNSGSPSYSLGRKHIHPDKLYDKNIKFNYKPDMPGPGSYEVKSSQSLPKYSIKGRNFYEKNKRISVPGPGAYNIPEIINPEGKYPLSSNRSLKGSIFGKISDKKFSYLVKPEYTPGPGHYDLKTGLSDIAKKLLNNKTNPSSSFPNSYLEISKFLLILFLFSSWTRPV